MAFLKQISFFTLLLLLGIFIITVFMGSDSLKSISIQFVGEGKEHQDKYIMGINSAERAPDYAIDVRVDQKWERIGSKSNQFSQETPLVFSPNKRIPLCLIEEVKLSDQDKIEHDILETLPFEKGTFQGKLYQYESSTRFSIEAGVAYFWHTAIGKAILAGLTICVIILILSCGII